MQTPLILEATLLFQDAVAKRDNNFSLVSQESLNNK